MREFKKLTAAEAKKIIDEKFLYPLFGMGVSSFDENLQYECFHHAWKEYNVTRNERVYTVSHAIENKAKKELKSDLNSLENKYLGNSADWYEVTHPNASAGAIYAVDDYRREKERMLNEIPDNFYVESTKYATQYDDKSGNFDYYAYVKISDPNGELLGIYCMDDFNTIKMGLAILKKELDIELTPLTVPYSPTQRAFLIREFLR